MSAARAAVIGGVNVDVLARSAGPLVPGVSTPGRIRIAPGGAGRNVAVNLARLGVRTALIAAAGTDPLTEAALAEAAAAGVEVGGVVRLPGLRNHYVAVEDAGAVRWAVSDMVAAEALVPAALDARAQAAREADAVVVDANLRPDTVGRAAELAGLGRLCLLAVSPAKAPRIRPVLGRAALLVCAAAEAEALAQRPVRSPREAFQAARALRAAAGAVVVTMGERGIAWLTGEEEVWVEAPRVEVVDPTGAGDAVAAVAVYALLASLEAPRAARLAAAAAAMTVTVEGATHPGLSLDVLHARA